MLLPAIAATLVSYPQRFLPLMICMCRKRPEIGHLSQGLKLLSGNLVAICILIVILYMNTLVVWLSGKNNLGDRPIISISLIPKRETLLRYSLPYGPGITMPPSFCACCPNRKAVKARQPVYVTVASTWVRFVTVLWLIWWSKCRLQV